MWMWRVSSLRGKELAYDRRGGNDVWGVAYPADWTWGLPRETSVSSVPSPERVVQVRGRRASGPGTALSNLAAQHCVHLPQPPPYPTLHTHTHTHTAALLSFTSPFSSRRFLTLSMGPCLSSTNLLSSLNHGASPPPRLHAQRWHVNRCVGLGTYCQPPIRIPRQ